MRDARDAIGRKGFAVDFNGLEPWEDPEVWKMLADGGSRAVYHIESPAMISLCRMCNIKDIDGLVAIVSVIRPDAANEQKKLKFTRRYQGLEALEYLRIIYGLEYTAPESLERLRSRGLNANARWPCASLPWVWRRWNDSFATNRFVAFTNACSGWWR